MSRPKRAAAINTQYNSNYEVDLATYIGESTSEEESNCGDLNYSDAEEVDDAVEEDTVRDPQSTQRPATTNSNAAPFFINELPIDYSRFKANNFQKTTSNLPDDFSENPTPLDYFQLLAPPSFTEQITRATNRSIWNYEHSIAMQNLSSDGVTSQETYTIECLTNKTMLCFFGMMVYMGIKKYPEQKMYFFKSKDDEFDSPPFVNVMLYKSFKK
eukprot:NODE_235_length_11996_cov_1.212070.p2 type:complete len:214 gc:universal NODE_235_length_11996_cov_1.212070:701-1342(+)